MLALIDQFPRDSRYNQAVSLDKEAAESYMQALEEEGDKPPQEPRPAMSDYSLEAEYLLDISNQLKQLNYTQVVKSGAKGVAKPKFARGPETIFEKIQYEMRLREHYDLVEKFLPKDR